MISRLALAALSIQLTIGCSGPIEPTAEPGSQPESLVLITYDALRSDSVGYAGHPTIRTPHLDALADRSVVFSQAISSFIGTTASMPSLMSGLYPNLQETEQWSLATWHGFSDLNDPDETRGVTRNLYMLAEILQERGWVTGCFTTNPNLLRRVGFAQGCDHYEEFGDFFREADELKSHRLELTYPPADLVIDRAVEWLDRHQDEPFFLWLHLMDPHSPYMPPEPFDRLESGAYSELTDLEANIGLYLQIRNQRSAEMLPMSELLGIPQSEVDALIEHLRSLYDGEVRFSDQETGRLLSFLDSSGRLGQTMVVATADHGEEFLDHGLFLHHAHHPAMEELIRIPLLMHLPGALEQPDRLTIDQQVRMIDIAPTVLDYLGLAYLTRHMDGVSLRPLIEGRELGESPAFVGGLKFNVLRTSQFKYRKIKRPFREYRPGEALFLIADDPLELNDVASIYPDELRRLRAVHDEIVGHLLDRADSTDAEAGPDAESSATSDSPVDVVIDAEVAERLKNLGYLD